MLNVIASDSGHRVILSSSLVSHTLTVNLFFRLLDFRKTIHLGTSNFKGKQNVVSEPALRFSFPFMYLTSIYRSWEVRET